MPNHDTHKEPNTNAEANGEGNGANSNGNIALFAQTNYRSQSTRFGIKTDDRRRHLHILGKTGMGKTNLLNTMAIRDIHAGHGIGVIDPHGEFVEGLLDHVPRSRINDVIYVNPADLDWPVAFNVLEKVSPEHRHLVASGVVGVFKKIWADSWGPRLEYVLRNGILALLESESSTLLGIMRILIDKEFRKKVITRVQDPTVRTFWVEEFTKYPDRFQSEAVAPIQNKVGQFLSSPLIRNVVGQTTTAFNLREVMDHGKILLLNLSKGRIGEDASALLGAMMVTKIQLAAMSRVDVPEDSRRDFYLYVDEFQNFATESFANILSEARKYRLDLILAHQYITQLPEEVRDAVFGNVGTLVTFRVGAEDAEFLEKEFNPEFTAQDLVNLAKYNIYLKLMIDGVSSRAFSADTLPPPPPPHESYKEKIIRISRERYSTRRAQVEDRIVRWYGFLPNQSEGGSPPGRIPLREVDPLDALRNKPRKAPLWGAGEREFFEALCAHCGKTAMIPFKPDGIRPVWCDDCLKKIQSGELVVPPRGRAPLSAESGSPRLKSGLESSAAISTAREGSERASFQESGSPILSRGEFSPRRQASRRSAQSVSENGERNQRQGGGVAPTTERSEERTRQGGGIQASRVKRRVDVEALRQVLKETLSGEMPIPPVGPTNSSIKRQHMTPAARSEGIRSVSRTVNPGDERKKSGGALKVGETVKLK